MAVCPKCSGQLGLKEAVCPHCGYDFPPPPETPDRTWQILLIGGAVVVLSVWGLWSNPVISAVVGVCQVVFILSLAFKLWRLLRDS